MYTLYDFIELRLENIFPPQIERGLQTHNSYTHIGRSCQLFQIIRTAHQTILTLPAR